MVDRGAKPGLLAQLLRSEPIDRVLVFTRTKHGADKVVRSLVTAQIAAEAIHGNKSQNQRERVLAAFRSGKVRILVATDIAARGIDVEGISHVVNFDLPNIPESYVHRIGRTARAGADGIAISFCDSEERAYLRDIEKLIRISIPATDQRGVRHGLPQANGDAVPSQEWTSHDSRQTNGQKKQQNKHRQNKPQQRKPHAAQPQQPHNGHQKQPQRNGHQQQPQRNGQQQPQRNGQQHQQHRAPAQNAGDGSIASVAFMRPTQRQKHHSGGHGARRSAR
jgi:superfamily II DNA/RNA helicase